MAKNSDDRMLLSDLVNDFLSRHRYLILSSIAVIALFVVAVTVYFSFASKKRIDDLASVERILFNLNKDREDIEKKEKEEAELKKKSEEIVTDAIKLEETNANSDTDESNKKQEDEKTSPEILEKEDIAILELEKLGNSARGYASYLAFYNIADMYFSRKYYEKAKNCYLKAYNALPDTYVAGVLLFNIGVCIEEMKGELIEALEYYERATKIEDFPIKPRVMLSVGRLQEKLGKIDEAIATYTDLFEKYSDNEFALIGKSRLIELNIKKDM
ncbi:MAG: tetratricopeptide repeat protein [Treponema sp.]